VTDSCAIDGDGEAWWISEHEELRRERLPAMVAASRAMAEADAPGVRAAAETEMRATFDVELARLRALRAVNDHVRQEEIDAAEQQVSALAAAIRGSRLRFDAIRLIVGTGGGRPITGSSISIV